MLAAGCATVMGEDGSVQRATEGPRAEEIYMTRFARGYARLPTFDESLAWRADLDHHVSNYLVKHPEVNTSPRASYFRFHRRVAVGMSKEEVTVLVGRPDAVTTDAETMAKGARRFWPEIKQRAGEMWVYPGGWQFYFEGDRLVDLTVSGKPPLE